MIVEILGIGREILDGRVVDTNSVYLAQKLKSRGLIPRFAQKVDDDAARMIEAFQLASQRSDVVLVTGGMGPTSDDITAEVFCRFLKVEPALHPEALKQVEECFARMNRPFTDVQKKQAALPPQARILRNREGTAPGFAVTHDGTQWYFMPGVPREMKSIFELEILAQLPENKNYRYYSWATQFTSEGELQSRLASLIQKLPAHFELSFRTHFPENHIGLYANCATPEDEQLFRSTQRSLNEVLGPDVFSDGQELQNLESVVLQQLQQKKAQIITVESCTGGLIAHRLTEIAGASAVFFGSFVTYDNLAKEDMGVKRENLEKFGAVSEAVAKEMAEAGLGRLSAHSCSDELYALSTTGIAGPAGGSAEKPVGTCFVGLARSRHPTQVLAVQALPHLDRSRMKTFFAQKALELLRRNTL